MTPSDTTIDYKVSSFQINLSSEFENRLLPNDLIIVRNHGDDEEDVAEEFGGVVDELEVQSKSNSCLIRSRIANVTYSINRIYPTSRKIGPRLHHLR